MFKFLIACCFALTCLISQTSSTLKRAGTSTAENNIVIKANKLKKPMVDYLYFNRTGTIVYLDEESDCFISKNSGLDWEPIPNIPEKKIGMILLDPFRGDRIFLLPYDKAFYVSSDNGASFQKIDTPNSPNGFGAPVLQTHPTEKDYMLFTGDSSDCATNNALNCHSETHYTKDGGKNWNLLATYTQNCQFSQDTKSTKGNKEHIFCQSFKKTEGNQIYKSIFTGDEVYLRLTDDFGGKWTELLNNVVNFGIVEEFYVAAMAHTETKELILHVSMDGTKWEKAHFPSSVIVTKFGYTVLESSTGRIFLDVYTNTGTGAEYGTLFRSNYNGTEYTLSMEYTNRNEKGYVDFEKMQGLKGIALLNYVTNPTEIKQGTIAKKLKSKITFNDGEKWNPIQAPSKDINNNDYKCSVTDTSTCSLNLHAFTDRSDPRDQFSSASSVGLMMGVGNVGASLISYNDCNTYVTRDAGKTWKEIALDAHMFEFGARGSVILLINDEGPTDYIRYSIDDGVSFMDLKLNELNGRKIRVSNIITESSGTSANFVIFGMLSRTDTDEPTPAAVHMDFSKVWGRDCVFDEANPEKGDFESWIPNEDSNKCIFGEMTTYYRRKSESKCYVKPDLNPGVKTRSCECVRSDFECDDNYELDDKGDCKLKGGATAVYLPCKDGRSYKSTGYRIKPSNKCDKGLQLHVGTDYKNCDGGGRSIIGWFFIILFTIAGIFGIAYLLLKFNIFQSGGRISLPMDGYHQGTQRYADSFAEKLGGFFRVSYMYSVELGEIVFDKTKSFYAFIRDRIANRQSGYSSLASSNYGGRSHIPDLEDTSLLDVDDDVDSY